MFRRFSAGSAKEEKADSKEPVDRLEEGEESKGQNEAEEKKEIPWDQMSPGARKQAKKEHKEKMLMELQKQYENEKKVDARLTEFRKDQLDDEEEKTPAIGKGPGSYDECVGACELFKSVGFFVIFIAGIFLGATNTSLRTCNESISTTQSINYCVLTFANTSAGEQYQCIGSGSTGCCDSSSDIVLPESERQGCILFTSSGSLSCLSASNFESSCKDETSCPSDLVSGYQNAIILYSVSMLLFSLILGFRGAGLFQYARIHYLDFYNKKQSCLDMTTFCMTKMGVTYLQWLLCLLFLPSLVWLFYIQSYNIESLCINAQGTDGNSWTLPQEANQWLIVSIVWVAGLLVVSSIIRFNFPIRPEVYNPQQHGSHECRCCGVLLDCRERRQESICNSSVILGPEWFLFLKHKTYCCWGPIWLLIYVTNVAWWLVVGLIGTFLEFFALRKHWISV